MHNVYFHIAVFIFFTISCSAQDTNPILNIQSIEEEMKIDGKLDELVYDNTEIHYLKNSNTGKEIINDDYKSYVQLFYDQEYFYMAFTSYDKHIHSSYTNRDEHLWKDEAVEAFIDVDGSTPSSYAEVQLSPANIWFDCYIGDPKHKDFDESTKYDLLGHHHAVQLIGSLNDSTDIDVKWTGEIAIPLKELDRNFDPQLSQWKINLYRINRDADPVYLIGLSPTYGSFHKPERFATLNFK